MTKKSPEIVCRYVGRSHSDPHAGGLDDTVGPAALLDALRHATIGIIDDPMSFPWDSVDLEQTPALIVDASRCSAADVTALLPVLDGLTEMDTVIDPADPSTPAISTRAGTRTVAPSQTGWAGLTNQKRILLAERRILRRVERELGDAAIVHRVDPRAQQSLATHLASLADSNNATAVGVWGVRSGPGAPVHHGLAVFSPRVEA